MRILSRVIYKTFTKCQVLAAIILFSVQAPAQVPGIQFTVSVPDPASHTYHVKLSTGGWKRDTLYFKMPNWTPGYYQLMNYGADVQGLEASGSGVAVQQVNSNTWRVTGTRNKSFALDYTILTKRSFVASSYVDTARAYLLPANSFLYVESALQLPVTVHVQRGKQWNRIATGLAVDAANGGVFRAADFDELYDCPILIGNLEELPSFNVNGANHRFIGYKLGEFDKPGLMRKLEKMITAATNLFGDVPYKEYTFIAIGPGRGGIEHANNTTVSFDGKNLHTAAGMNTMLNFLAHEYIHHFNVKRIRPFELGPFDYEKENRTNQLWISEGLTVYYEYIVLKRAGLASEETMLANLEGNLNAHERNTGRLHQSLVQASYKTWREGPFGTQGDEKGKTISYYDKGPLVGMLLDLAIRQSTANKKSLDAVMRYLYQRYYQQLKRGFTEAEFREACELTAGSSLAELFEYVYTTKELDYNTYLQFGGLQLDRSGERLKIVRLPVQNDLQKAIYRSWMGE
jgi:predicted metalloprotease with PDZ domain